MRTIMRQLKMVWKFINYYCKELAFERIAGSDLALTKFGTYFLKAFLFILSAVAVVTIIVLSPLLMLMVKGTDDESIR